MDRFRQCVLSISTLCIVFAGISQRGAVAEDPAELRWTFQFDNVFVGGSKPLLIYANERGGRWITGVGSSRDPSLPGAKKTYNRSWYFADMRHAPIVAGKMQGVIHVHVTPDLWVPRDHKGFVIDLKIDAELDSEDQLTGRFEILEVGSDDVSVKDLGRKGIVRARAVSKEQPALPDPVTLTCNMQGALIGGDPAYGDRCMILSLGLKRGVLVSTARAVMDKKLNPVGLTPFNPAGSEASASRDEFRAKVAVPTRTLDMEPCTYAFDIEGHMYDEHLVGTYHLTVQVDGKSDVEIQGSFDGRVDPGVTRYSLTTDERPWFTAAQGFKPVEPGEHPRLLFRKADLPALRAKANTPHGKAMLRRLRYLLDGADGETMTNVFSDADHAYMGGGYSHTTVDEPGVFTIGHVAGYGLLYQLTGDKKYAEFGRQAFEKSLEGVRDRDDRYSFRGPGGPLRAGPSLGWHAVGYDLCYDGWDEATREKFGRALAEYAEASSTDKEKKKSTLESLTRGTMPPASNHFGMQVGGAALALLTVDGEPFVDQQEIDRLLLISEDSMIRNLRDGFGDGGFFKEGDGTGSMASQIAFVTALQGWRNAKGKDFMSSPRPNARMAVLKWIYQTVVRAGRPDFWPIRGSYGHNVWAREGLSGAGYFAIGMGPMPRDERSAMKWFYSRFLADADRERGCPNDTVSTYPHVAVCAFVNWPDQLEQRNPEEVLPHCYRDKDAGFYLWRNRWQDENDTVITLLTTRTQGFMVSKPDRALKINSMGEHSQWGVAAEGPARHWSMSPRGETSSLTLSDGGCFAVDFTGASGADVMLVTTGQAQGPSIALQEKTLTFAFPTAENPPTIRVEGNAATIGRQRVMLQEGNLVFAATE